MSALPIYPFSRIASLFYERCETFTVSVLCLTVSIMKGSARRLGHESYCAEDQYRDIQFQKSPIPHCAEHLIHAPRVVGSSEANFFAHGGLK